jgi:hypothetical protein
MSTYTVDVIADVFPQPTAPITAAEYINFVVNRAAESYMAQYGTASKEEGIQAACDAFNASIPPQPAPEGE